MFFQKREFASEEVYWLLPDPQIKPNVKLHFYEHEHPNSDKFTCIIDKHVAPDSTQAFFSDFAFFFTSYKLYDTYIFKEFTFMYLLTM